MAKREQVANPEVVETVVNPEVVEQAVCSPSQKDATDKDVDALVDALSGLRVSKEQGGKIKIALGKSREAYKQAHPKAAKQGSGYEEIDLKMVARNSKDLTAGVAVGFLAVFPYMATIKGVVTIQSEDEYILDVTDQGGTGYTESRLFKANLGESLNYRKSHALAHLEKMVARAVNKARIAARG